MSLLNIYIMSVDLSMIYVKMLVIMLEKVFKNNHFDSP